MERTILEYLKSAEERYQERTVYLDGDEEISFKQLYRKALSVGTAVAGLQSTELPVAVLTGRHIYTPACYLGIAMAGCFYAPMDPTVPDARLLQILSVTSPDLLLTDRENLKKAEALGYQGRILLMEDAMDTAADEDLLEERRSMITEDSPLYVLFTSGSSGLPKGVLTSHRALICYLEGLQSVIGLDETDVIGNQAPLDYIAAIRDMYLPLITGAKTVIISPSEFAMPERLFSNLKDHGVTTLCWSAAGLEIPAKLGTFEAAGEGEESVPLPPLRRVVFSGSVISNIYLRMWQDAFPETVFINQYGPTEATGSCTYYVIEAPVERDDIIPIGAPYPNYQILLLKDGREAVPAGEAGEICVAGPAVALGYYNAPEQTADHFVINPLRKSWPQTIYRTGDLGRMDEDGTLYFLGRMDRQFKHMGHRIEPEEIEQKASLLEGVEECSCAYDKVGQRIFLFYSGTASPKELTLYFRGEMPSFMVPRKIVCMEELPHLPNGKLNRKLLQEMADEDRRRKRNGEKS